MKIVVKDVTGEIYSSPDVSKDALVELFGGKEVAARKQYSAMMEVFSDFKNMTNIIINVGTFEDEQNLTLNPANVIWVRIDNRITEWEDESW